MCRELQSLYMCTYTISILSNTLLLALVLNVCVLYHHYDRKTLVDKAKQHNSHMYVYCMYMYTSPLFSSVDFGCSGEDVEVVEVQEYVGDPAYGTATTQLHKVHLECVLQCTWRT